MTDAYTKFVLDNLWVFIAGILVFLMQAGFGLVEAGLTRSKNVGNIMAKNLSDMVVGSLAFFVVGFAIAFGDDSLLFLRGAEMFESGVVDGLADSTLFFFQVVFAATAVTIASGAMAERTKFTAYLIFAAVMTAFIYPMVVRWIWGGGWLSKISVGSAVFSDFAGSTVVHSTGAWAALTGAVMLGPRLGKYGKDGRPRAIPGHNIVYTVTGVFILWFGWFGFNAGSELAVDVRVPFIAVNTLLAAAAGGVGAAAVIWRVSGIPDVAMVANGVLAGLVSVTAGAGSVTPVGSVLVGMIGGCLVVHAVLWLDRSGIDDPVGAISVHGACGIWGTLAVGLFARHDDGFLDRSHAGLLYGGGLSQLVVQIIVIVAVAVWTLATVGALFWCLQATFGLRVTKEEEMAGLDVMEHGTPGYSPDALSRP